MGDGRWSGPRGSLQIKMGRVMAAEMGCREIHIQIISKVMAAEVGCVEDRICLYSVGIEYSCTRA